MAADLLAIQRLAGNRAAGSLVGAGAGARANLTTGERANRRQLEARPAPAVLIEPASRTAQRAPEDNRVTDLFPDADEQPDTIFFGFDSAEIPPTEAPKIPALATQFADQTLTLKGTASEEGASAYNRALTDRRIRAVESAFASTPHDKRRTPLNKSEAKGNVDYRAVRSVKVIPATESPEPECRREPGLVTCDAGIAPAMTDAINQIAPAKTKLAGAAPDSAEMRLFETLFRTKDDATKATAIANLTSLESDLTAARDSVKTPCGAAPSEPFHQCEADVDSGCGTGAFAFRSGRHLTFCSKFMATSGIPGVAATGDETRRHITLHEGAHLALSAGDIAKSTQRAFTLISTSEALDNADSYAVLVRNLNDPNASPTGPINPDVVTGVNAAEAAALRPPIDEALAWLEKWIEFSDLETSQLYRVVDFIVQGGHNWDVSPRFAQTMCVLASQFEVTPPPTRPRDSDKPPIAAAANRFDRMARAMSARREALTITIDDSQPVSWVETGDKTVSKQLSVNRAFIATSDAFTRTQILLRAIADSVDDISDEFVPKFTAVAPELSNLRVRGLGPAPGGTRVSDACRDRFVSTRT